eukprot:TRINITY_DN10015_c0_g1_i1.p1 TRINITY_DN10015_c0_g1~~TRINITY_DN10015_c0_g1_i1.p1  ORF type:complete len:276 (+),score=37.44 TRINITY_DN10015_c0_g1_i1:107-934(+)
MLPGCAMLAQDRADCKIGCVLPVQGQRSRRNDDDQHCDAEADDDQREINMAKQRSIWSNKSLAKMSTRNSFGDDWDAMSEEDDDSEEPSVNGEDEDRDVADLEDAKEDEQESDSALSPSWYSGGRTPSPCSTQRDLWLPLAGDILSPVSCRHSHGSYHFYRGVTEGSQGSLPRCVTSPTHASFLRRVTTASPAETPLTNIPRRRRNLRRLQTMAASITAPFTVGDLTVCNNRHGRFGVATSPSLPRCVEKSASDGHKSQQQRQRRHLSTPRPSFG